MLNWLVRYAVVAADLDLPAGDGAFSVLDVGCGPVGLSCVFPQTRFAGQDLEFPGRVPDTMFAIRTAPGPFPWADGAFDTVISLDALEHVPGDQRASFIAECSRVAARRVFLSCPTSEGTSNDEFFERMYRDAGVEAPAWLDEHAEFGLPAPQEIEAACDMVGGFTRHSWPQVNGLLSSLTAVGDLHPYFSARAVTEYRDHRDRWIKMLGATRFNEGVRRGVRLTREAPLAALVDPARFEGSAFAALRCPACGAGALQHSTVPRCGECGLELERDDHGALDLRPTEVPKRRWWRRR